MRENTMEKTADKTIITVVGKDTVGIIAKVCTYLASNSINDDRGYEQLSKTICRLRKRIRAAWRRNWRKDQMPERRNF